MHTEIINKIVKKVFNSSVSYQKRLTGGMSNYVYLITVNNETYIFRIPGEASEYFSDKKVEQDVIDSLSKQRIMEEPIYFDVSNGYKISKCIKGVPLNKIETKDKDFKAIADCLKQLHGAPLFKATYNYLEDINTLQALTKDINSDYDQIKDLWYQEALIFLDGHEVRACHCDSQPNNFILSSDHTLHLIDWELAMNNDPIFDIACFGEGDFNEAILLFEAYYPNYTTRQLKALYLWRIFQCLKWYNGALFKHEYGLSESLKVDFKSFSNVLLQEAITLYQQYKKL